MSKMWRCVAALALWLGASSAWAEPDTFGVGTGRDGALHVSAPGTRINTYATVTWPLAVGDGEVRVSSTQGVGTGDLVMVLQTTGVVPEPASGNPWPLDLSKGKVGRWELARIAGIRGSALVLTEPLVSAYDAQITQVIRVPEYTKVTVDRGASLVPAPWDGLTGGVLAFLVAGELVNEGRIDATGAGFRGGVYVRDVLSAIGCDGTVDEPPTRGGQKGEGVAVSRYGEAQTGAGNVANGGGGGVCLASGGGGGGNAGPGGQGGHSLDEGRDVGGMGGGMVAYSALGQLLLGGGGGAGHGDEPPGWLRPDGGRGGGVVFIRGARMLGKGAVLASGEPGGSAMAASGGGGGAGGTLYLRLAGTASCGKLAAAGGAGGGSGLERAGPGGGGGGGQILFQASSGRGCPDSALDVGAGLAGAQPDVRAAAGVALGAQPGSDTAGFYRGRVTRLAGMFKAPSAPRVDPPAKSDGYGLGEIVTGSAAPGSTVILYVDGVAQERVTVDGSGRFRFTLPSRVWPGRHEIRVAVESDGVQSVARMSLNAPRMQLVADNLCNNLNLKCRKFSAGGNNPDTNVQIDWAPPNPVNVGDAVFLFHATTALPSNAGYKCSLNFSGGNGNDPGDPPADQFAACPTLGNNSGTATYSLSSSSPKTQMGPNQFLVAAYDLKGPLGPCQCYQWVVVDGAVTLDAPASPTKNQTPTFTGTGIPGEIVTVYNSSGDVPLCSSVVAGSGTNPAPWNCAPSLANPLAKGDYSIYAKAVDAAGNPGQSTSRQSLTIDLDAPGVPTINSISSPTSNAVTPISGTGTGEDWANKSIDHVSVYISSSASTSSPVPSMLLCSTKVDYTNGVAWRCTPMQPIVDGAWYIHATATDLAGNSSWAVPVSLTIDTIKPMAPNITAPDDGAVTWNPAPVVSGTAEASSIVTVELDGTAAIVSAGVNGNWNWMVTPAVSGDGLHKVRAMATDQAHNQGPWSPLTSFYVYATLPGAPTIARRGDGGTLTNETSATFDFSPSDAGLTVSYQCTWDDGGFHACTTPLTIPTPNEGPWVLSVRAINPAGDAGVAAASPWTVDHTPPDTWVQGAATLTNNAVMPFQVGSDAGDSASFECLLDGVDDFAPCTPSSDGGPVTAKVGIGTHTLQVRAVDRAGNVDPNPAAWAWTMDNVPPVITWDVIPPDPSDSYSAQFSVKLNPDAGYPLPKQIASLDCSLDTGWDGGSLKCPTPFEFDNIPPGTRTLTVRATDTAGNVSSPLAYTWVVDPSIPETFIRGHPPARTNKRDYTFWVTSSLDDAGVTYVFTVRDDAGVPRRFGDGGTPDPDGGVDYSDTLPDMDGLYTLEASSINVTTGRSSPTPARYQWTLDRIPPSCSAEFSPPLGADLKSNQKNEQFILKQNETVTYTCTLEDGETQSPCSELTGLKDGLHQLSVTCMDEAGNASDAGYFEWTVKTTLPPAPEILSPGSGSYVRAGSPIKVSAEGPGHVNLLLDGKSVTQGELPGSGKTVIDVPLSVFSEGDYKLTATCTDDFGNNSLPSDPVTVHVQSSPPRTTILQAPAATSPDSSATFTFESDREGSTFRCTVDSDPEVDCQSPYTTPELSDENHTFVVFATDRAGNQGVPARFSWRVASGKGNQAVGGGFSCSAGTGGPLVLLCVVSFLMRVTRRRRSVTRIDGE